MKSFDAIILGSSPNALTAAAYLAKSGKKVLVLEQSVHLGGAQSSSLFASGIRADIGLTSGRLGEAIVKDLKLADHGLEVIERNSITSLLPDGRSFTLPADRDAATAVIKAFSEKDAARYKPFMQLLDQASDFLRTAYTITPPKNHPPSNTDLAQISEVVGKLRSYGNREMTEIMRLLVMSVRDFLDEWFESPELKGLLAATAIRGVNQGPFAGSTVFNLLHHIATGDGFFCATARGGIGAISQSLASAAESAGVEIRTSVSSLKVSIKNGVADGVYAGDELILASMIISGYDARYTFTHLVDPPELDPEFNRAVKLIRYNGAVARINLALRGVPKFTGISESALRGTLKIAPSISYLEKAFDATKYGEFSKAPFIELSIPSLSDETLAPAGKHVMSIWMQYSPYRNKLDRKLVLEIALDNLKQFAPDLNLLVEHSQVIMPRDLEEQFHLTEGQLYGAEMSLSQAFYLRQVPGFQYDSPIAQLYLCGAATHPGGGAHGIGGRNIARELGALDMVPV